MKHILLEVSNISKTYRNPDGSIVTALKKINFSLNGPGITSIIGPSGSGKSTLFNIISGLAGYDTGNIKIKGNSQIRGKTGYMFQDNNLFPWKTNLENVMLGPLLKGYPKKSAERKAEKILEEFGLLDYSRLYPEHISGGMRQKVSLLRTILLDPDIMLLDEPFGSLDAITRQKIQIYLLEVVEKFGITVLMNTHDIREAVFVSDRIIVLSNQPGTITADLKIRLPCKRKEELLRERKFLEYEKMILSYLTSLRCDRLK